MPRPIGAIAPSTQDALDLVLLEGASPYAAAIESGIAPSTVYRALARARDRQKAKPKVKTAGATKMVVPSRGAGRAR